jgi:glycosyltransferase involved in cell wall biosynthesis
MLPISVIIPCYNAEQTLARTLDSCIAQPEAAQILVVDDGSRDASPDIAAQYAQTHPQIELLRMPQNGGAARARNWGAMHALHPLLAFIDADDEYMPHAERYFRISMGMLQASDELVDSTRDASWRFVRRAYEAIQELRGVELAPHLTAQQGADSAPDQSA